VYRVVVLLVLLVGVAVVSPAAGKEGVQARIATPIPRESAPGTRVTVVWTLTTVDDGKRIPFGAGAVFVRLFGPGDARTPRAFATELERGRYRARPRIPAGGVRRVVIGLMGIRCDGPGQPGCVPAPALFPVVGKVFR
jgi:hypothetical protein